MNTAMQFSLRRIVAATLLFALGLTLASAARAADSHPLPLWKVGNGQGQHLYLAGSMHALSRADYPLPEAFKQAFKQSNLLIEEINLNVISPGEVKKAIQSFAVLPEGNTLADAMGEGWDKAQKLAGKDGVDLAPYEHYKPWFAAFRISAKQFREQGYVPSLGLDFHFAGLAQQRDMPIIGLETISEQLSFFNSLDIETQRHFLLQTLEGLSKLRDELMRLHAAWRVGNLEELSAIAQSDFAKYPDLRTELLEKRNRGWMPTLERCFRNGKTCFVVVGAEHMAGEYGLIALLREDGYRVEQLTTTSYTVPAPATAPPAKTSAE
ncbi:MAG: TraB/GumN family protein [Gammaproteobacteria bacterium]|nr:TraB/GumN family protein [Gammaproteobacteria bacterium]